MKIRDIIDFLEPHMTLVVQDWSPAGQKTFDLYNGPVEDTPYWIVEKSFTSRQSIEVENNSLIIDISQPVSAKSTKQTSAMTNQQWMDALNEENVLLFLAGLLYHYDVGTIHDDCYDDDEWKKVFNPMIEYVEKRIGGIACSEKLGEWYKSKIEK